MQKSTFRLAVDGLGALDNVDGDVIAKALGIDMGKLSRDVIIVIAWVGGLFALLLLTPVTKAGARRAGGAVSRASRR
jgi:hypothetical protein